VEAAHILVLVVVFIGLLLIGVPIAFAIGVASTLTLLLSVDGLPALTTMAQRLATGLDSFALLAIPFFILSGQLMNRGGIARRLVDLGKALVGGLPGGLVYVNIVACVLFAAISGSAVAAAAAIGGFMIPLMLREGYERDYGAAVNIASATTGLIIPPSNILIVYSLASGGASIAALFVAGYLPGLVVAGLLMLVAGALAKKRGYPVGGRVGGRELMRRFVVAVPSLLLIVVVIGGIIAGIFTATEAAGVAVLYAFVLSVVVYREIPWRELPKVFLESAATSGVVLLLIGTSMGMSWVMAYDNIPQTVASTLLALAENKVVILLIVNAILLAVGTFMDMTPAVLIFTPIFLPVAVELGIDPIQFGIIMVLNLCIGLCTPPVGSVLFVGCSVAETSIQRVVRFLLPLYLAMLVALGLVTLIPELSLSLPRLLGLI
jgi:tripartite ATP-independent transporter DctM subunit